MSDTSQSTTEISARTEARLLRRMESLATAFGLSAEAPYRLVEVARAEIEADERFVNSDRGIERAVARAKGRLLARRAHR